MPYHCRHQMGKCTRRERQAGAHKSTNLYPRFPMWWLQSDTTCHFAIALPSQFLPLTQMQFEIYSSWDLPGTTKNRNSWRCRSKIIIIIIINTNNRKVNTRAVTNFLKPALDGTRISNVWTSFAEELGLNSSFCKMLGRNERLSEHVYMQYGELPNC